MVEPDNFEALMYHVRVVQSDLQGLKEAMTQLTMSMNKLAVIEERLTMSMSIQEDTRSRLSSELVVLRDRISELEVEMVDAKRSAGWVNKLTLAAAGAAIMYMAKQTGLFS